MSLAKAPELASAVVVGTGLIGTSIALALRERGVWVGLAVSTCISSLTTRGIAPGTAISLAHSRGTS